MDDAKYTFISDVKDRKSMLSGARSVKRGSKSKKCTLPSDYLSKTEKQKLNGEVKTYKMREPITWKEFKEMPKEHQENYLVYMIDTYHVTAVQLGEMMGISDKTLGNYLRNEGLNEYLPGRGHKMTKDQKKSWDKFLSNYNRPETRRNAEYYKSAEEKILNPKYEKMKEDISENMKSSDSENMKSSVSACKVKNLSIGFEGDINYNDIIIYLKIALGETPHGHLQISFQED